MININLPKINEAFLFEDIREHSDYLHMFPGGIYMLYNVDDVCIYIGKSKQLYKRLRSHRSSMFADEIYRVEVICEDNPSYRDILETYAIMTYSPTYNRDKLYEDNNGDFVRMRIDGLHLDLEGYLTIKHDLEAEYSELEEIITPPSKRSFNNNFDPHGTELSGSFYDYLEAVNDFNSNVSFYDYFELERTASEIEEVESDIMDVKNEIDRLLRSLQV